MPLFKLAWVTSWLSVLLASSQDLLKVSDRLVNAWAGPSTVLALNWAIEIPTSLQTSSGLLISPLSFGSKQLRASHGFKEIVANQAQLQNRERLEVSYWRNTLDRSFCYPDPNPEVLSSQTAAKTLVKLPHPEAKRLTHRLERALQVFLGENQTPSDRLNDRATLLTAATEQPLHPYSRLEAPSSVFNPDVVETVSQDSSFQIWVNGKLITQLSNRQQAELTAKRLQQVLRADDFEAREIHPASIGGKPAAMMKDRLLFVVNEAIAVDREHNRELLTINWVNNLRVALNVPPLTLAEAQSYLYDLVPTDNRLEGWASWYGDYFHGRLTANGEIYDQLAFTAAHPTLPFNTYLKVTNLENNHSAIVRINDRGPFIAPRTLDLSRGVARCINSEKTGVVRYSATVMENYTPMDNI
ncbi:MAG: septal ring lytic transglycosylase RlpA family protein [Spirulinaceae cyanobacterium]